MLLFYILSCSETEKYDPTTSEPTECTTDWCDEEGSGNVSGQEPQPEPNEDSGEGDDDSGASTDEPEDTGNGWSSDDTSNEDYDDGFSDSGAEDSGRPKDSTDPCGCAEEDMYLGWILFMMPFVRKRKKQRAIDNN